MVRLAINCRKPQLLRAIKSNKNQMDLDVIIKLSNDFSKLSFVYLIDNQLLNKQEILKDKLVEIKK